MTVVSIKKADACVEGNIGYDVVFDEAIDKNFTDYLGMLGKYIYNDAFDVPFYKVIIRGMYSIKGSIGNYSLRLLIPESIEADIIDKFKKYVDKYQSYDLEVRND